MVGFVVLEQLMNVHVFGINFAPCEMDNVTIPMVYWRKNIVYYCVLHHQFQRGMIWIQKTMIKLMGIQKNIASTSKFN